MIDEYLKRPNPEREIRIAARMEMEVIAVEEKLKREPFSGRIWVEIEHCFWGLGLRSWGDEVRAWGFQWRVNTTRCEYDDEKKCDYFNFQLFFFFFFFFFVLWRCWQLLFFIIIFYLKFISFSHKIIIIIIWKSKLLIKVKSSFFILFILSVHMTRPT